MNKEISGSRKKKKHHGMLANMSDVRPDAKTPAGEPRDHSYEAGTRKGMARKLFSRGRDGIMYAIAALIIFSAPAFAQQMPDSIFDTPPDAFYNTLLDVPPDATNVQVSIPEAGGPAVVTAVIKTDPVLSLYRVVKAQLRYYDGKEISLVDMNLIDEDQRIWQGEIPAMASGTKVKFGVMGWDEVGNAVVQLIDFDTPVKGGMLQLLEDEEDEELEGSLDLVSTTFASDGKSLSFCHKLRKPFMWSSPSGAAVVALGFYYPDVRTIPAHSHTENTSSFVAYFPFAEVEGVVRIDQVLKGKGASAPADFKVNGTKVCGNVAISDLMSHPEKGVKMFSATAALEVATQNIVLGDSTPYAIVYFKGGEVVFP